MTNDRTIIMTMLLFIAEMCDVIVASPCQDLMTNDRTTVLLFIEAMTMLLFIAAMCDVIKTINGTSDGNRVCLGDTPVTGRDTVVPLTNCGS